MLHVFAFPFSAGSKGGDFAVVNVRACYDQEHIRSWLRYKTRTVCLRVAS